MLGGQRSADCVIILGVEDVSSVQTWIERQSQLGRDRQRSQSDTMKLLATFASGVAASLAAAALQATGSAVTDRWAIGWLTLSCTGTLLVIITDRLSEGDTAGLVQEGQLRNWSSDELMEELRVHSLAAYRFNEGVISQMRYVLAFQIMSSVLCGVFSSISLLGTQ